MTSRQRPARPVPPSSHFALEQLETRTLLAAAVAPVVEASFLPTSQFLFKRGSFLTKRAHGAPLDIALQYLRNNARTLGITAADVEHPIVTDLYTDSDSGTTHIYLRQRYNGLPVANADLSVTVLRDGRILSVGGAFISGLGAQAAVAIAPAIGAADALAEAAKNLQLRFDGRVQLISEARDSQSSTVLSARSLSLDDIPARLQYVPTGDGSVELAWNLALRVPGGDHWYDTNVSARDGSNLFTADWTDHAADYSAAFNVYPRPLKNPDGGARQSVNNPWDLAASPFGWQDLDGDSGGDSSVTSGNNVSAQDDIDNNNSGGAQPAGGALAPDGSGSLNFNFPVDHSQAPVNSLSAATVNLYYWNNLLHDIHYKYGFTEPAGNFQFLNYTGTGDDGDGVEADSQDGSGTNNANFSTPPDGSSGRMQMYTWNYVTPNRDSSFDSQVIIHEYGHGVSNRLTGGPSNSSALNAAQSGGMGEGWGDWWGLMLLQADGSAAARDAAYPMGAYSIGETDAELGIRRFPYSFNKSIDPRTLGLFNATSQVHATGEIWCSTLWDMNWLLINKHGFNPDVAAGYTPGAAGNLLALRLVMDALKIQPANPSLLQARDAILAADVALTGGANQKEIWAAFARRGFGTSASTTDSNSLTITEAFDVPAGVATAPFVTHHAPLEQLKLSSMGSMSFQFARPMNPASFSVAADVASFTGPGGADLKPLISGFAFSNGNRTLTVNFTTQTADGTYTMTIGPNITIGGGSAQLDQDLDGTPGEATADQYTASVTINTRPGPDATGYEAALTTFENIDLVAGQPGVFTLMADGDDTNSSIPLGANTFRFYGTSYTGTGQLFASDNGLLTFGTGNNGFLNRPLTFNPFQPAIAPLWDDWALDSGASDQVLYRFDTPNNRLIIEWSQVINRGDFTPIFDTTAATFQAILSLNSGSNNGDIIFNYPDLSVGNAGSAFANGGSASVGIKGNAKQGPNRLLASQFNWPNGWLGDGKALRITTTSVSGTTYVDADGDAVQDAGESILAGVTIYVDANNNQALDPGENSTISSASGTYTLTSVPAGSINIRQITPAGYAQTSPAAGAVSPAIGQQMTNVRFGNFPISYAGATRYYLRLDAAGTKTQIFVDATPPGTPDFTADKTIIPSLTFIGSTSDNTLTVDLANGNPIPAGGVSFDGLGQSTDDVLEIVGSSAADTISVNGSAVVAANSIGYSNLESILIDSAGGSDVLAFSGGVSTPVQFIGGGSDDTLTISGAVSASPAVNLGPGNDTLSIAAGSTGFALAADGNAGASALTVSVAGSMTFTATQHLAALNILATGAAALSPGGGKVLRMQQFGIAGAGRLDLNDGSMIVDYAGGSPLAAIQSALQSGYNSGAWSGNGILSGIAAATPNRAIGFAEASDLFTTFPQSFAGEIVSDNTAVLLRFTRYGDADLNGNVNSDDFNRLASSFGLSGKRWSQGNFNFDAPGLVNSDDFNLLATNFGLSVAPNAFASRSSVRALDNDELQELL